jgi:hypothetical protein
MSSSLHRCCQNDAEILVSEMVLEIGEMDGDVSPPRDDSSGHVPWFSQAREPDGPPPKHQLNPIGARKRARTPEMSRMCDSDDADSRRGFAIVKKIEKSDGVFVSSTQMELIIESISRAELAAKQAMLLSQSAAKAFGAECSNLSSVKANLKDLMFQAELDTMSSAASSSKQ